MNLLSGYEDMWKAIIRPPRDEYSLNHLGPAEFRLHKKVYKRNDFQLKTKRNLKLECSHFEPAKRVAEQLPCVIYMHGNSSSRIEALSAVEVLLPSNVTLFCFDFAGCGKSEGEYISLGWFERDDLADIIEYLRNSGTVSTIGLWGRSMGAVTALMHADRDPSIAGMVLDSPFSDLKLLAEELVKAHSKIPKFVVSGALSLIRKTIQGKNNLDINNLVPMNHVEGGFVPAFFVTGEHDNFIDPHHTKDLYDKYAGEKSLKVVEGDHNSQRPQFLLDSIGIFFYNTLQCETLPSESQKDQKEQKEPTGSKKSENEKTDFLQYNYKPHQKIGNDNDVVDLLAEAEDEQLRKAIEESLKMHCGGGNQVEENKVKQESNNQPGPKSKSEKSKIDGRIDVHEGDDPKNDDDDIKWDLYSD